MKLKLNIAFLLLVAASMLDSGCKKSGEPTTGELKGIVKDATTAAPLENASVVVFNADNNAPIGQTLRTSASGEYAIKLEPGNYFIKLSRQGYYPVPPGSLEAVPFSIAAGQLTQSDAEMFPSAASSTGWITGTVTESGKVIQGALVVATNPQNNLALSTSTDANGAYSIFNVPAGTFNVQAYLASYNSNSVTAAVTASTAASGINIAVQKTGSATLSGTIRNLAIDNKDVDITLVHPITKETIPGLTTTTNGLTYSLVNIPNGSFIARATYKNDLRVMDPDRIAKFGEPVVTVSGGMAAPATLTFDVTGPVTINSPSNPLSNTIPVNSTIKPLFQWTSYPSTSDYVIEVMDAATGQVVWGGFDQSGSLPVKKITIPGNTTSILYNSDGKASLGELVPGKIYRWRVYASKNDQNSTTGWTLISMSEDQVGLIRVKTQ